MCAATKAAELNNQTSWILVTISDQAEIYVQYHPAQVPRDSVVRIDMTTMSRRELLYHPNRPWMLWTDFASGRRNRRAARRRLRLSKFDFDTIYWAGIKHRAADVLSHMPTNVADTTPIEDEILIAVIGMTPKIEDVVPRQHARYQADAHVVEANSDLQKR